MAKHWLMKSEPEVYSIDDLKRDGHTCWEGVRNYSARNNMQAMAVGDLALFYHSNAKPPGVAGIARICREAYPDQYQWDRRSKYYDAKSSKDKPRWYMVDVEFVETFERLVPLDELKSTAGLGDMVLLKQGRLSVQPVTRKEFDIIRRLAGS